MQSFLLQFSLYAEHLGVSPTPRSYLIYNCPAHINKIKPCEHKQNVHSCTDVMDNSKFWLCQAG